MIRHPIVLMLMWIVALALGGRASAEADVGEAHRAFQQGEFGIAIKHWEAALTTQTGQESFDILLAMASAYQTLGRIKKAFTTLEEAHEMVKNSEDTTRLALVLGRLSDSYLLGRQLDESMQYGEKAVAIARQAAVPSVLAGSLNYLGNALVAQEDYARSLTVYKEAIDLAEDTSDTSLTATLLTNIIHVHLASNQPSQAVPILAKALQKTGTLPASHAKAYGLIGLGHLAQRLSEALSAKRESLNQSAYDSFVEARALGEQFEDPRTQAYAIGHLGELYAMQGRVGDAERLFRQALFFAGQADAPELLARWYWQQGRLLKQQGKTEKAKTAYKRALAQLGSIQPALVFGQRGNPRSFRETVGSIYLELAEILLEEADAADDETARHGTLLEVRDVMEGFKTVELQNHFRDECVTELQRRIPEGKIEKKLGLRTATLYPIIFPKRLVLLTGFADGPMQYMSVAVEASELKDTVTAFRKQLIRPANPRRLRKHGLRLYQWLIKPIAPELSSRAIDTLVVVPDDVLRMIPFGALFDGDDFLVKRYAFAVTPGLSLTDPGVAERGVYDVLLGGLSDSVREFEQLPHVSEEIDRIAALYGGTQLINETFLKKKIQTELRRTPYSMVAFATHAEIQNDPRRSFLVTYDDQITFDELESFARISQFRKQPVELMVLSACETAEGDERAALGLAGVAVKAGARSVMASLWKVNDASTAQLVPDFFRHLSESNLNKAQALQRAQQSLITQREYDHPFYWAGFVLIGNWL